MVNFSILAASANCDTDTEKVALALYYLHKYENCEVARYDDVGDVIRSSDVVLSSQRENRFSKKAKQAVIQPLDNLRSRDLANESIQSVGYYLTEAGQEFVEKKITGPLPDEDAPRGKFIEFEVDDEFVSDAIREINLCYGIGAYTASLVMLRRLIEELLIQIHKGHFGDADIEKYYDPESGRHKNISQLIKVFQNHLSEFARYTTAIDNEGAFVDDLTEFRKRASSQAHSIDIHLDREDMRGRSNDATRVIKILYKIKMEVEKESQE